MINTKEHELGGAQIVPTARRSIHQHLQNSQYKPHERMGRIGLRDDDNSGIDEIDNIQSKFSRSHDVSPVLQSRRKIIRQNSTDTSNFLSSDTDTDEENKHVHSKSLPTYLHTSTYSSDLRNKSNQNNRSSTDETSPGKGYYGVTEHRQASLNDSNSVIRNFSNNRIYRTTPNLKEKESNNNTLIILAVIVCLVGALVLPKFMNTSQSSTNYDVFHFYNDMDNLRIKYELSRDSILQVKTGISTIYDREDTGSFIFLYDSRAENFKSEKIDKLLNDISLTAAKYLRNETLPVKHLAIAGSELQMSYHGELISQYRGEVSRTGVMLVKDVDNVPSSLAMAFHYYCDEYNPLVRRSAIFFTLDMAKCEHQAVYKSTHAKVEKCLTNKWSGVPEDNIKPLLTRVVSVVIDFTNIF